MRVTPDELFHDSGYHVRMGEPAAFGCNLSLENYLQKQIPKLFAELAPLGIAPA